MRRRFHRLVGGGRLLIGAVVCIVATETWAQEPPPRPASPATEALTRPQDFGVPVTAYPAELLGLLASPAERGPVTLRPSIGVSEEYNDNVNLDSRRQWDLITRFTPGITLTVNRPSYRLSAGYTVSGELHVNESRLNDAHKDQAFVATGFYEVSRGLTLTVGDTFSLNRNTNQVGTLRLATGQQETWSNTFTPGMRWELTPRETLNLSATFSAQRFLGSSSTSGSTSGAGSIDTFNSDSNTYGLTTGLDHTLTRRLTGTVGYSFTYLDFLGRQDNSTTHTPTIGARYLLTPTLTVSVMGGPAITQLSGETIVSPGVSARLLQVFQAGTASLEYSRSVSVAGGLGGPTDTQVFTVSLSLPTWQRGLVVTATPSYQIATSSSGRQASQVDVRSLTVPLSVNYQLARYTSIFAEYVFYQQRSGSSSSGQGAASQAATDLDQNRLRFGVQFGYPFNFE